MGGGTTLGSGGNSWGRKASGVYPEPHGVEREEGGREASRVEENPGRGRHGFGGVESSPDDSTRHREGGGVELSQNDSDPKGGGGGVKSWQDDSTPKPNGGGVESSWDD